MGQLKLQMEQFEVKIKKKNFTLKMSRIQNSILETQPKCYEDLLNKCRKPHIYRAPPEIILTV